MSWRNDRDSDDSDVEETDYFNFSTAIIINNSEKMFIKTESEDTCPFQNCLEALYNTLDKYIFSTWNSRVCIQLLDGREHGFIFDLSSDLIGIMQKLLEVKDKQSDDLKAVYCSQNLGKNSLYESLKDAYDCLCKKDKTYVKNIVILTNEANCGDCEVDDDLDRLIDRMAEEKVQLIVVPLLAEFDWSLFYGQVVAKLVNEPLQEEFTKEGYEDVENLTEVLDKILHPKRSVRNIAFYYGPGDSKKYIHLQV